jgi:hypothetical protein
MSIFSYLLGTETEAKEEAPGGATRFAQIFVDNTGVVLDQNG